MSLQLGALEAEELDKLACMQHQACAEHLRAKPEPGRHGGPAVHQGGAGPPHLGASCQSLLACKDFSLNLTLYQIDEVRKRDSINMQSSVVHHLGSGICRSSFNEENSHCFSTDILGLFAGCSTYTVARSHHCACKLFCLQAQIKEEEYIQDAAGMTILLE